MYIYGTLIQSMILQLSKSTDVDSISYIFLFFLIIHVEFLCQGFKRRLAKCPI